MIVNGYDLLRMQLSAFRAIAYRMVDPAGRQDNCANDSR